MGQNPKGIKRKAGKTKGSKPTHEEIIAPTSARKTPPSAKIAKDASELVAEWDLKKALELRFKGVSYGDIAKHFGVPKPTVQQRLKPFVGKNDETQAYRVNKADILSAQQLRFLTAVTDAKLKKASAKDLTVGFGILNDKERLERGQSTSNQSVFFHIVQESDEAD